MSIYANTFTATDTQTFVRDALLHASMIITNAAPYRNYTKNIQPAVHKLHDIRNNFMFNCETSWLFNIESQLDEDYEF